MKTFFCSLLLWTAFAGPAAAQTDLAGTWQGRLQVAPGNTLAIHFVIAAKPGGGYSALVTSPDSGAIKNVPATRVTFADSKLTIDVPALSGGYTGALRNGVLVGEWSQEGAKLPLSLKPFETPTLTKADIDMLRGEWFGKYSGNGMEATIVLRFSTGGDGALRALMDIPEQGVKDWAVTDVVLDDGHFSVKMPALRSDITGQFTEEQIVGRWNQIGSDPVPLTLKKGRHVLVASYLDLPPEARAQLVGRWRTPGPMSMRLRIETDPQGRTRGFLDIPQQNVANALLTQAELAGTKLTFGIASFGAKYTGELAGDKLTGEWTQTGMSKPAPLVFMREK